MARAMQAEVKLLALAMVLAAAVIVQPASAWDFTYVPCSTVTCPDPGSKCTTKACGATNGGGVLAHWKIPLKATVCGYNTTASFDKKAAGSCGATLVDTPGHCCTQCSGTVGCTYWQFLQVQSDCGCGLCFLFNGQQPKCATTVKQFLEPASYVGGKCNGMMTNDPHLVGAHGTHFDFVGEPDRAFCVVSDKRLHINAGLKGYMDSNTKDAVLVKDGQAVHTWVKELGVVWTHELEEHTLKLVARSGPQAARGLGFLKGAEVDGKRLASPSMGQELMLPGGLKFKFVAREQNKKFEVDVFTVVIEDLLEMELRLRAAEPALRTKDEAYVHLSMTFKTIKKTESIHGVLGQTYRDEPSREQRAVAFSTLVAHLHAAHVAADADNGNDFLDGKTSDYVSSTILSTDCHFSSFGAKILPALASQ